MSLPKGFLKVGQFYRWNKNASISYQIVQIFPNGDLIHKKTSDGGTLKILKAHSDVWNEDHCLIKGSNLDMP